MCERCIMVGKMDNKFGWEETNVKEVMRTITLQRTGTNAFCNAPCLRKPTNPHMDLLYGGKDITLLIL